MTSYDARATDLPVSQCAGKEAFRDLRLAENVASRRRRAGHKVRVYRCPHCSAWHMGTPPVGKKS
jgi:hypothetical protein